MSRVIRSTLGSSMVWLGRKRRIFPHLTLSALQVTTPWKVTVYEVRYRVIIYNSSDERCRDQHRAAFGAGSRFLIPTAWVCHCRVWPDGAVPGPDACHPTACARWRPFQSHLQICPCLQVKGDRDSRRKALQDGHMTRKIL